MLWFCLLFLLFFSNYLLFTELDKSDQSGEYISLRHIQIMFIMVIVRFTIFSYVKSYGHIEIFLAAYIFIISIPKMRNHMIRIRCSNGQLMVMVYENLGLGPKEGIQKYPLNKFNLWHYTFPLLDSTVILSKTDIEKA